MEIVRRRPGHPRLKNVLDDVPGGGPQTILVIGSDERFEDRKLAHAARSDTMILVRLDPDKEATAVMSIPRDLKVKIPGHGTDKINAAYSDGGPKLTVKTVRNLLHVPINHVVNVNFGGFRRAVNRLGVRLRRHRPALLQRQRRAAGRRSTRRSTSSPATRSSAARTRSTTCASATRTTTSCAPRASRTSCARPRAGRPSSILGDRAELVRIFGRYTHTDCAPRRDPAPAEARVPARRTRSARSASGSRSPTVYLRSPRRS